MTVSTTPERVQELLAPIPGESPVGSDLDPQVAPYTSFRKGLSSSSRNPNYEKHAQEAVETLTGESKHLQIIAWLILCWLKLEGLPGLRDGLRLMAETVKQYKDAVYPPEIEEKRNAVQYIASEKRIQAILKRADVSAGAEDGDALLEARALLGELPALFSAQIGGEAPDLGAITTLVDDKLNEAGLTYSGASGAGSNPPTPDRATSGDAPVATNAAPSGSTNGSPSGAVQDEPAPPPGAEEPGPPEPGADAAAQRPGDDGGGLEAGETEEPSASDTDAFGEEEKDEPAPMPVEVEALLDPLESNDGAGEDIENTEDPEDRVLYRSLKSEMRKRSGNNYPLCVNQCVEILTEKSKHLRIAFWLCVAWFRTESLQGLRNGLVLLDHMLKTFGDSLYPRDEKQLVHIVQRLNTESRILHVKKTPYGNEEAVYEVTKEKHSALDDQHMRARLHALINETYTGKDAFDTALKGALSKELYDSEGRKLFVHFLKTKPGYEQVPYQINARAVRDLKRAGLPADMADALIEKDPESTFSNWLRYRDGVRDRWSQRFDRERAASHLEEYGPLLDVFLNRNLQLMLDIRRAFEALKTTAEERFASEPPRLSEIAGIIEELARRAQEIRTEAVERFTAERAEREREQSTRTAAPPRASQPTTPSARARPEAASSTASPSQKPTSFSVRYLEIDDPLDAIRAITKGLLFHFEEDSSEENNSNKVVKAEVARESRIYGMSRALRWSNLKAVPEDQTATGPDALQKKRYKENLAGLDPNGMIGEIERLFIKKDEFLFWLDGQQLIVGALEQLGAAEAAHEVRVHLAALLHRFPDLPSRTYRDGSPFASEETKTWLEDDVVGMIGGGKGQEKIMPPLLGEDYTPINEAYERACEALPDGFEEHAMAMHRSIDGETRRKGRFLIRLNLANYYSLGKKPEIARATFNQLIDEIEAAQIAEWEPALCVSVWQSAYLNNAKLMAGELNESELREIKQQQRRLFEMVAQYDGVLALKLNDYIHE